MDSVILTVMTAGQAVVSTSCWWLSQVYWAVMGTWLWNLYRHGPHLTSWGFWAGMADEEVCAKLSSGSQVKDWLDGGLLPTSRCTDMISRSFHSFTVSVHSVLYLYVLYTLFKLVFMAVDRMLTTKTLAGELKTLLDAKQ